MNRLVLPVAALAFLLAEGFSSPAAEGSADPNQGIAALERLGGQVIVVQETQQKALRFRDPSCITDESLEHLKALKDLHGLNLARAQVTDAGLQCLKGLTELRLLALHGTKVTGAGLEHLKGLTKLQGLYLDDTPVADAGLEHLKVLGELDLLSLNGTGITDAGLEQLKGLTSLRNLSLDRTRVTDAGMEHLKGLPKLVRIQLAGTQVTPAGVATLRKILPNLEVSPGSLAEAAPASPVAGQKPAPPSLLRPAPGAVLNNRSRGAAEPLVWEFEWSGVTGASRYHLHVMGPTATIALVDRPDLTGTSFRFMRTGGYISDRNRLGWRCKVRALVDGEWTDWSAERTFDVAPLGTAIAGSEPAQQDRRKAAPPAPAPLPQGAGKTRPALDKAAADRLFNDVRKINVWQGKEGWWQRTYTSGPWQYKVEVEDPGGRMESRRGSLWRDGKPVVGKNRGDEIDTPWGRLVWGRGASYYFASSGWLPAGGLPVPTREERSKPLPPDPMERVSVSDLIRDLGNDDPAVRARAAYHLGRKGQSAREAAPRLLQALQDPAAKVRAAAAEALGDGEGFGTPEAVVPLAQALQEKDSAVRFSAALALSGIGGIRPEWLAEKAKQVVPALARALEDDDFWIRRRVAALLGRIGPAAREAVPALAKALEHEDAILRRSAAEGLGAIGPDAKEAIPALTKAAEDRDPQVASSAAAALKKISP